MEEATNWIISQGTIAGNAGVYICGVFLGDDLPCEHCLYADE